MAERQGFEPWNPCELHAFQACRFSRSRTSPDPFLFKEFLQQGRRLELEHSFPDLEAVIPLGVGHEMDDGTAGACFLLTGAEHETINAREGHRAHTHRTGFKCNIKRRAR